jgi:hypothetical protein
MCSQGLRVKGMWRHNRRFVKIEALNSRLPRTPFIIIRDPLVTSTADAPMLPNFVAWVHGSSTSSFIYSIVFINQSQVAKWKYVPHHNGQF